ncbi:signal peptidase I [Ureibacillus sp. FSL E2-3493]|uniref:signal peptidase I n=1 Tax=Ureibacillus sp. FSL E2-3493 TaxID=2921367 RepID=UPI003119AC96
MGKRTEKNESLEWIKTVLVAFLCVWGIRYFLFAPTKVEGASMMPTFEDGDRVIVNKIGPRLTEYERFDVIVFKATEEKNYIKRIIGLPGDQITYEDDVLYINGRKYDEPYLEQYKKGLKDHGTLTEDFTVENYLGEKIVPEGYLFVLGDNRRKSIDSRDPHIGFVPMDKVLGTADIKFWPLNHLEFINKQS